MPRRPRLISPGVPLHIIQRGNNRQACFFADEDYLFYLDWLHEYAKESGVTSQIPVVIFAKLAIVIFEGKNGHLPNYH